MGYVDKNDDDACIVMMEGQNKVDSRYAMMMTLLPRDTWMV